MFGKVTPEQKAALKKKFENMYGPGASNPTPSSDAPQQPPPPAEANDASDGEGSDHEEVPPRHAESFKIATETLRVEANSPFVEITNVRLFTMDDLDLNSLSQCTTLSLRKNLIHELSPLPLHLANRLVELDFFDNKIRKLRDFFTSATVPDPDAPATTEAPKEGEEEANTEEAEKEEKDENGEEVKKGPVLIKKAFDQPFKCIIKLDLSYNQIKHIKGLDSLAATLKELYLVENRIKEVQGLDALVNLELLELGGNRIRSVGAGVEKLVNLKQLWLGKNKIVSLGTSLHNLSKLELLSLQANRILKIEPENFPEGKNPLLKELYLSENGIEVIENLPLHKMKIIDFSFDPIKTINADTVNVENFPELEEFWLTDGKVDDWAEVDKLAPFSKTLHTVYLERNAIENDRRYRDKVYMKLPFLHQIDSWPIVNKDNLEADRSIQRKGDLKKEKEKKEKEEKEKKEKEKKEKGEGNEEKAATGEEKKEE